MPQIADWLEKLGMAEYTKCFAENRIDFSVLRDLTDQDLKDLGVLLGDRPKLLRAITTLMYALYHAATSYIFCGNYAAAHAHLDALITLADEGGATNWKALGTAGRGRLFAVTGNASDAVRAITSGIASLRS